MVPLINPNTGIGSGTHIIGLNSTVDVMGVVRPPLFSSSFSSSSFFLKIIDLIFKIKLKKLIF
jgi:hypothetical protein